MPTYKTVVFDLDGTLLNTLEDLWISTNATLAAHGMPEHTIDDVRRFVGNGIALLIHRAVPAGTPADVEAAVLEEFKRHYGAHCEDHTAPYPGVIDMLDALRDAGAHLAVLSNKDHPAAEPLVARYFGARFDLVQGRIDAYPPKPAAPITRYVLDQLEADPAKTLYVGDSNVDVATGHNAGLAVAGVSWGFRGRTELEQAGADYIVDTPAELEALVLDSKI